MSKSVSYTHLSSSADSADKTEASSDDAAASDATYEGTIKIGVVGPFSGSSAMVGDTEKKGVELAAKQINENGGINGMTIELIEEDDQMCIRDRVRSVLPSMAAAQFAGSSPSSIGTSNAVARSAFWEA